MIDVRATAENAMFCALRRAEAQTRIAVVDLVRVVECPLQHLHAAERAADRAVQPRRSRGGRAGAGARVTRSATVKWGKRRPYGLPVAGSMEEGPVVPRQPPSRFGQITNRRSVSSGLPGPISVSHQPGRSGSPWCPAACASPVSAWQTKTAFERVRGERAVGLVGDLDRGERARPIRARAGRPR